MCCKSHAASDWPERSCKLKLTLGTSGIRSPSFLIKEVSAARIGLLLFVNQFSTYEIWLSLAFCLALSAEWSKTKRSACRSEQSIEGHLGKHSR